MCEHATAIFLYQTLMRLWHANYKFRQVNSKNDSQTHETLKNEWARILKCKDIFDHGGLKESGEFCFNNGRWVA